ncbi:alpha/beta fold hydrolase [Ornithinimicrobium pratense]|uniref:Alpha/beta hydrolase n=1 Tax=Ornithinimicrobium pratense TaxID=2593973 RepID=A0A5J6VA70_9MICO|nr:alpha/beta hydrolase [Ornithinimicrobium pratense]QFG69972.1 alpha/beta hydrolase [Ornithinimicrobium pratense]
MTWAELTEQIGALLEPWDVGDPQGGEDYLLWCGNYALVQEHLPHLPQVREQRSGRACIDLTVEREAGRVTRVDYEGYSPGETLSHLGLVRQSQEYAAAVPGSVASAGPAVLAALRLLLQQEDVRHTGEGAYRMLGTEPAGTAELGLDVVRPALVLPGGPLLDTHYLGDLGGAAHRHPLAVVDLPWRRVTELVPVVDAARADLGPDSVNLIAHSAGAALALAYLAAHPDRVRGLVLVCPAIRVAGVVEDADGVEALIARRCAQDKEYAAARAAVDCSGTPVEHPRISFGRWSEQHEALAATTTGDRADRLAAYYAEPLPDTEQIREAAAGFAGPVTVLHGELDLHPTTRQARDLAALFPHGEAVELAGAAHYPWLDDTDTFVDALLAALRD